MTIEFDVNDSENINLNTTDPADVQIRTDATSQCALSIDEDAPVMLSTEEDTADLEIDEGISFGGSSDYEDLDNKPSINGVELIGNKTTEDLGIATTEVDPTVPAWAKQPTKPPYTPGEVGAMPLTDLGSFDMEEYDWDFWAYLEDKTASGFYKVNDEQDGFDYFFKIERTNNHVYQEWWYEEEGALYRNLRCGWLNGDEWDWSDTTYWVTDEQLYNNFYGKWQTYTKQEVNNLLSDKVDTTTLEDNYYTSEQVDDLLDGFAPNNMIPILWADLVELRDNGELTAGAYYRITDYNFVTTKANVQSGNHPFDIVVLAVSESMVSETAYACRHAGDTYFEREVTTGGIQWLYTLYVDYMGDNYGDEPVDHADDLHAEDEFVDSDVLTHPVSGEDVPVLYKTNIEEYDLDDPDYDDAYFYEGTYDFDGDEFDMWSKYEYNGRNWVFTYQYALTPIVVEDGELIVSPHQETKMVPVNMSAWELKYCLDNDKTLFDWAIPEGKGVIYYLKDEFGNEAGYDFKNVMFRRKRVESTGNNILNSFLNQYVAQDGYYNIAAGNDSRFFYTFVGSDASSDGSLFGECNYTTIMPYIVDGKRTLNDLVLYWAINSYVDQNCYDCTFTGGFRNVRLGSSSNNLLISGCNSTTFKGSARNSTFINLGNCEIGLNFANNIGASTADCRFGAMCQNNNYGTSMSNNSFGDSCSSLTFGNYCYGNQFGNSVMNSTFGNYCSYNTFEGQNNNITFTNYIRYCTIELTCTSVKLNTSGGGTSSYIQYVKVCKGVKNFTRQPTRGQNYEQIFYKTGRTETAV